MSVKIAKTYFEEEFKSSVTAEKAQKILAKHGTIVTIEEAQKVMDFMNMLAPLAVEQAIENARKQASDMEIKP